MTTQKRILFTGGSGKAGKHVVPYLLDKGHRVVNVDLTPLDHPGVDNLTADITDSGQMFNVMTSYANFDELEPGNGVPAFDAVVHFAAIPRILIHPDNETFRVNAVGTYNVIEAAVKLGSLLVVASMALFLYTVLRKTKLRKNEFVFRYDVGLPDTYYRHELQKVRGGRVDTHVPRDYVRYKEVVIGGYDPADEGFGDDEWEHE